jgi:hypothetical protein
MAQVSRADHPVLQQQQFLSSGIVAAPTNFFSEIGDTIDSTPAVVAGFVLGAAVTLFALKSAGFRFNFGVGAKVG